MILFIVEDDDKKKKISAVVVVVVHHCIVKSFDVVEVKRRRVQKDFHIVPAPEGLVSSHVCHQHGNIPRGIPKKHTHKKKRIFLEKLDREKKKTNFFL